MVARLKRRRFLSGLAMAAGASAVVAIAGCQPGAAPAPAAATQAPTKAPEPAKPAATAAPTVAAKAAPSSGLVQFTFWSYPVGYSTDWPHGKWETQVVEKYQANKKNVKIEYLGLTWEMIEKVDTAITSGSPPDLIGRAGLGMVYTAEKANVLQEVEIPKDIANDLPEGFLKAQRYKGKAYLVPWYIMAEGARVNVGLAKEAGAESLLPKPPAYSWNWDDFLKFAKAVTIKKKDGQQAYGTYIWTQAQSPAYHWTTWQYLWNMGVDMYQDPENGGCVALDSDVGIKALQYMQDLYTVHKVVPNPSSTRYADLGSFWDQGTMGYRVDAGLQNARAAGTVANKQTMVLTAKNGVEWMFCQNPTAPGVQHKGWGGAMVDTNFLPFRQKDAAKWDTVLDFAFFFLDKEQQQWMAQFQIPARVSVANESLKDDPFALYTLKYLVPGARTFLPDGKDLKLREIFGNHFQELYLGKSAKQVAQEFAAEANQAVGCKK